MVDVNVTQFGAEFLADEPDVHDVRVTAFGAEFLADEPVATPDVNVTQFGAEFLADAPPVLDVRATQLGIEFLQNDPYPLASDFTPLSLPGGLLNLFPHNWASAMQVEPHWLTDITRSAAQGLVEERRSQRDRPRRIVRARWTALDRAAAGKAYQSMMRLGAARTVMPLYSDFARVTSESSGSAVYCNPSYRRFYPGGRAVVHKWIEHGKYVGEAEYFIIGQVFYDRIVPADALSGTFPRGSRVMPVLDVDVSLRVSASSPGSGIFQVEAEAEEVAGPSCIPPMTVDLPSSFDTYLGIPIFPFYLREPGDRGSISTRVGRRIESGTAEVSELGGMRPLLVEEVPLAFLTRATWWNFLLFSDWARGRRNVFWYPRPESVLEFVEVDTDAVRITAAGDPDGFALFNPYIAVRTRTLGTIVRSVEDVTDEGDTWLLTLDDLPAAVTDAEVVHVTTGHLVRMQNDFHVEEWVTDEIVRVSSVVVEELQSDEVVEIDGLDSPTGSVGAPDEIDDLYLWCDASSYAWNDLARTTLATSDGTTEQRKVRIWDDVRTGPGIPFLFGGENENETNPKLHVFPSPAYNNGRPAMRHTSTSGGAADRFYLDDRSMAELDDSHSELAPAFWSNSEGFTVFWCGRMTDTGSAGGKILIWRRDFPDDLIKWEDTKLHLATAPGATDSTYDVTYSPQEDRALKTLVATWSPGFYTRVYRGGALLGQATTAIGSIPTDEMENAVAQVFGSSSTDELDASYTNSVLIYSRALSAGEMNAVGRYLESLYGAPWTDI